MLKRVIRRSLGPILCWTVLFGLTVSPLVHECAESIEEAAYHQHDSFSTSLAVRAQDSSRPHHDHHDPSTCGLCLTFARIVGSPGVIPARQHSRIASRLIDVQSESIPGSYPGSASPRGPPLA
jgi:hypothetical protein